MKGAEGSETGQEQHKLDRCRCRLDGRLMQPTNKCCCPCSEVRIVAAAAVIVVIQVVVIIIKVGVLWGRREEAEAIVSVLSGKEGGGMGESPSSRHQSGRSAVRGGDPGWERAHHALAWVLRLGAPRLPLPLSPLAYKVYPLVCPPNAHKVQTW